MIFRSALFILAITCFSAKGQGKTTFTVIPLGIRGGIDESNLSAYLVGIKDSSTFVCVDAGTVHSGIERAIELGSLKGKSGDILKNNIKGYLISHPHLDHVAGLIINSPEDSRKPIYGLPFCLDVLKDKYFSWKSWANFGNEGEKPTLNKYHYIALTPDQEITIESTTLRLQAFPLSHASPGQSTAFLIQQQGHYLLYLGDTGADAIEHSKKLEHLWQTVAPVIQAKKLSAIFIEVSYPNEQPEKLLFGHLTPKLLMQELQVLHTFAGDAMRNLPVVITHMKPTGDQVTLIQQQVMESNSLGVKFIFPQQGQLLEF